MSSTLSNRATLESFERLLAAEPYLDYCAPLSDLVSVADTTLLHAGPPLQAGAIPAPLVHSAVAAALFEGWARDDTEARDAITRGNIRLASAQDHGVVTPLAFVVSPSMWLLRVSDAAVNTLPRYAPVNDGPPPAALRFGARHESQAERLVMLSRIGPALRDALREPIAILPIMEAGLDDGDDLHGRVSAANSALADILAPRLFGEAKDYLPLANQFVLNVIMAACALMIGAGSDVAESRMVIGAGGNGVDFGWRLAGAPTLWHTMPAQAPVGPHFSHAATCCFLPAIGDSAVIDACGFDAAALRYAPEMVAVLRGRVPDDYFGAKVSASFLGPHPALPSDLRLGLDIGRTTPVRGVMLAALDAAGEVGLVGRGIATWPQA